MTKMHGIVGLVAVLVVATPAVAQEWTGSFSLEGRHDGHGAFTGKLEVRAAGERFDVTETLTFATGSSATWRGTGDVGADGSLEADLGGQAGLAGAITGTASATRHLSVKLEGRREAYVRGRDAAGASDARAKRDDSSLKLRDLKGKHLLSIAKDELGRAARDAAYDGVRLDEEFGLHRFLHVGVAAGVRPLRPETLSPTQRENTGARGVWIVSEVGGGARLPFTTSVPLGAVTVTVGIEAGGRLRYEVTDRYELPAGITDGETIARDLKAMGARSFDLPIDAAEALALTPGARRVLEGQGSVALSGNLSVGHEVANIEGIVRIGASARVGGYWRVQGDVRFEVERLSGRTARLRVTRGVRTAREVSADVLIGASVDESALAGKLEYIDTAALRDVAAGAAGGVIRDVVRFELRGALGGGKDDEIDVAYRFDLGNGAARAAYERAVRGDLTAADAADAQEGSGVRREYRVFDVETRTYRSVDLALSVVLRAGARRTVTWTDLSVQDDQGVSKYELFRFSRERSLELFGNSDNRRRRAMELDVIRRATPNGAVTRSLRWSLDVQDPYTTTRETDELRRALAGWGLEATSSLPTPESRGPFHSRYGRTNTRLSVEIAEAGVARILTASEEDLLAAYVDGFTAVEGELPTWATAAGRESLRYPVTGDDTAERERTQLMQAERFVKGVRALAASEEPKERARRLESLAKGARYDLYAISALLALSPRDTIRVTGSIEGERISIGTGHTGSAYTPLVVNDPRR